jgi:hypothetical protein
MPLSPLLFNLCREPLLETIMKNESVQEAYVRPKEEEVIVNMTVQTCADDVVFV